MVAEQVQALHKGHTGLSLKSPPMQAFCTELRLCTMIDLLGKSGRQTQNPGPPIAVVGMGLTYHAQEVEVTLELC